MGIPSTRGRDAAMPLPELSRLLLVAAWHRAVLVDGLGDELPGPRGILSAPRPVSADGSYMCLRAGRRDQGYRATGARSSVPGSSACGCAAYVRWSRPERRVCLAPAGMRASGPWCGRVPGLAGTLRCAGMARVAGGALEELPAAGVVVPASGHWRRAAPRLRGGSSGGPGLNVASVVWSWRAGRRVGVG